MLRLLSLLWRGSEDVIEAAVGVSGEDYVEAVATVVQVGSDHVVDDAV